MPLNRRNLQYVYRQLQKTAFLRFLASSAIRAKPALRAAREIPTRLAASRLALLLARGDGGRTHLLWSFAGTLGSSQGRQTEARARRRRRRQSKDLFLISRLVFVGHDKTSVIR